MKKLIYAFSILALLFQSPSARAVDSTKLLYGAASGAVAGYMIYAIKNSAQAKEQGKMCGPQNAMSCIIAVAAAAQAVIMVASAFDSQKTANDSQCQGSICGGTEGANPSNPNANINPYTYNFNNGNPDDPANIVVRDSQDVLKDMKAKGYEVDSQGNVKTPKGTMTADQVASAGSGMSDDEKASLGITPESVKAAAAAAANFEGSSETGGGKKSGGGGGDGGGAGFDMNAYMKSLMGNSNSGRGVAGLSVKAGNDNIGVKESNIFEQASRAYSSDKVLTRTGP